jgi:hypothetical protein
MSSKPKLNVTQELTDLFFSAQEEFFEDGMDSTFALRLIELVVACGIPVVKELERSIANPAINSETSEEALKAIGRINDPETYSARLSLLEYALASPEPRIRDAAGLGLASLDDPRAIPYLKRAVAKEEITQLRRCLQQVLDQLKDTQVQSV